MAANDNRNGGNKPVNNGNKNRQALTIVLICIVFSLVSMSLFSGLFGSGSSRKITYDRFIRMLEEDKVASVELSGDELIITSKPGTDNSASNDTREDGTPEIIQGGMMQSQEYGTEYYTVAMEDETALTARLEEKDVEFFKTETSVLTSVLSMLLSGIIPFAIMILLFSFIMRKAGGGAGGMMGVGKSKAKTYIQKDTGVTFKDVAGEDEAKESLQEIVGFLHNPQKYKSIGAKLPKGALLVGPPGTGKTLLAKAVAGEAKVPFFSLSGSEFVEMFVGVGASRVRDLFEEAKKNAPCIIFIDEIDAIGKSRDSGRFGGNDEREQTLNQLLAEMDGFDSSKGILILAATNRPEVLDPALLRQGRFDRRIVVERPDLKGRVAILRVHAKNVLMDETVDLDAVALATSGAVGSDLANMINEAAILAVKHGRHAVCQQDLLEAVEVVLVGKEKKDRILSAEERKIVSYHEVGHALMSALQKNTEPVQKITIIPRTMGALGFTMNVPEEEKYLNTKKELEAQIVMLLGGRAAEEVVFDTVTTGAANDIERATKLAKAMITLYGMSEKFGLMALADVQSQYLEGRASLNCGDATATEIDREVSALLKKSYEEAKRLLSEHREALDKIAEFLIKKETITGKEFMEIFREVEGIAEDDKKQDSRISGGEAVDEALNAKMDENATGYGPEIDNFENVPEYDPETDETDPE
ncbi:MAG: ATP-dependent zinc metalloprotease FtsH [Lachnospiraceae bacterium]|jgi:cell division protease FtsH